MNEENVTPTGSRESLQGLTTFDNLRAENEPWLSLVFESPPEFDLMLGPRSAIIFGDDGSGKSAIYRALIRSCLDTEGNPQRLPVSWHPLPPQQANTQADSQAVYSQLAQVLEATGMSVVHHLAYYPEAFKTAPAWAREMLAWFIHHHIQGDFEVRTGALATEVEEAGQSLLEALATWPVREVFRPGVAPELIIAELVKALRALGLDGAWVLVDGLETWTEADPDRLAAGLTAFLSALNLFEKGGFAYKLVVPTKLRRSLSKAGSIARHRVDVYHFRWPVSKLVALVEKRLAAASGQKIHSLSGLCSDKGLINWLERCGATSPRGWLDSIRPLVAAYLERERADQTGPVTAEAWQTIRRRNPPLLTLDERKRQVTVGWREIKDIPTGPYTLLRYLYERSGQICTRSELYYLGYLGLEIEPLASSDPNWEAPKSYDGLLDTTIWRLRTIIEPEPKDPLFIITVKGQGIRLENAW